MNEPNNTNNNKVPQQIGADNVLVIEHLTKKFGTFTAVDNISLEVKQVTI
jgi:ABC-type uncharacterized transport system ATPase subunit